eukprot:SAG31_NODE_3111_length_4662_cov_82.023230_2_plen_96_part_00
MVARKSVELRLLLLLHVLLLRRLLLLLLLQRWRRRQRKCSQREKSLSLPAGRTFLIRILRLLMRLYSGAAVGHAFIRLVGLPWSDRCDAEEPAVP